MSRRPARILSGGQTGVDRAALDAALAARLACGGWCPRDRWAEDGPIAAHYPLVETDSTDPAERTRRNVRDADATLVLARGPLWGGTALARAHAEALGRPVLVVDPTRPEALDAIREWLARHPLRALNVAGPRESEAPGSYARARRLLGQLFRPLPPGDEIR